MTARRPAAGSLTVLEGIDGSGKSSLAVRLAAALRAYGLAVESLAEPGPSPWGQEIRRLAAERHSLPPAEELRLFIADRRWDVETRIAPALAAGRVVVLDRYYFSNVCYQGAHGLDRDAILAENLAFAPVPDLVLWVDVEVETALARIGKNRRERAPLFERAGFLHAVQDNYRRFVGPSFVRLDGTPPEEEVFAAAWAIWAQHFELPAARD